MKHTKNVRNCQTVITRCHIPWYICGLFPLVTSNIYLPLPELERLPPVQYRNASKYKWSSSVYIYIALPSGGYDQNVIYVNTHVKRAFFNYFFKIASKQSTIQIPCLLFHLQLIVSTFWCSKNYNKLQNQIHCS